MTLPDPDPEFEPGELHRPCSTRWPAAARYFFRPLSDAVGALPGPTTPTCPGPVGSRVGRAADQRHPRAPAGTLSGGAPRTGRGRAAPRARYGRSRRCAACGAPSAGRLPARSGPPAAAGRWALLPERETDATRPGARPRRVLLERHGVVTRGAAVAERVPGGFAAAYRVLSAFEDAGRVRRGYFVEGLGASQFATTGAVDRLRASRGRSGTRHRRPAAPSSSPPPTPPTPTAPR